MPPISRKILLKKGEKYIQKEGGTKSKPSKKKQQKTRTAGKINSRSRQTTN